MTSARRSRWRPLAAERPPSLSVSARFSREACQAGAQPKSMPARLVAAIVNSSTGTLSRTSASDGSVKGGMVAWITSSSPRARATPRAPPTSASTTLSVSSCRTSRLRPAPSAERTTSSRWRAEPRASCRFATLAQAISSTKPTAASSSHSPRTVSRSRKLFCSGSTLTLQPFLSSG
jgi:hypothetical protein